MLDRHEMHLTHLSSQEKSPKKDIPATLDREQFPDNRVFPCIHELPSGIEPREWLVQLNAELNPH